MNLINPKPRFGYNPDSHMVYDYVNQRDVAVVPSYAATDGTWDLTKVVALILGGQTIESARISNVTAPKPAKPAPHPAPVAAKPAAAPPSGAQAAATAAAAQAQANAARSAVSSKPPKHLSSAELKQLGLTPLQIASLQITPVMLANGLNWAQIQALRVTASRAAMLKLDASQAAALAS